MKFRIEKKNNMRIKGIYNLCFRHSYVICLLIGIPFIFILSCQTGKPSMHITKEGRMLTISGVFAAGTEKIEIRISSSRNESISYFQQVSPNNPDYDQLLGKSAYSEWEIFYPVIDVIPGKMHGIAVFDRATLATYSVNGMFHQKLFNLNGTSMVINPEYLQNWENNIYMQPSASKMISFYLSDSVSARGRFDRTYRLLSESWSGEVTVNEGNSGRELVV